MLAGMPGRGHRAWLAVRTSRVRRAPRAPRSPAHRGRRLPRVRLRPARHAGAMSRVWIRPTTDHAQATSAIRENERLRLARPHRRQDRLDLPRPCRFELAEAVLDDPARVLTPRRFDPRSAE